MMSIAPLAWVEGAAATYIAWEAIVHINREGTKAWAATTLYWALLGAAAMWSITGVLSGNPRDALNVALLLAYAVAIRYDRLRLLRLSKRLRRMRRLLRRALRRLLRRALRREGGDE